MRVSFSSTGADLEALTDQAVRALTQAQRDVGRAVAKVGRKAILDDVRRSRRGGLSMSGMNARLGAKTKVLARANAATVVIDAKPPGPWAIVEAGADPHEIEPKRRRALYFDGLFSAHAAHPGSRATRAWSNAEAALEQAVGPAIEDVVDDALEV
jgi:hypothetical protein